MDTTTTKTIKLYRAAVIILLTIIAALGTVTGILLAHHDTPAANSSTSVSSFNDGWTTSKQDDCQQGSAYACAWLKSN